jgi:predicted nucleic acid-binding protein
MKLVMDSDALIKLTKAGAKETILNNIEVCIPPFVMKETTEGKEKYPDALKIEENISKGLLKVGKPCKNTFIEKLEIKGGEAQVLMLYDGFEGFSAISSDDGKFLNLLENLNVPYLTPTSIIVYLLKRGAVKKEEAKKHIENLRDMVSDEEYHLAMDEVENDN